LRATIADSAPIAAVVNFKATRSLAGNDDLGVMLAELYLSNRTAS
jgi:hypothetical protein